MASLRLMIPRAGFQLHAKQLQQRLIIPGIRHASTTPHPKPRVLAQPDKFRPPSHPSRLQSKTPRYQYGPDLTPEQRTKKKYPHMMPPEGSFMHWFLTNRTIHLWISLSILVSLVFSVWISEFIHNTPYRDLLPPNSMLLTHPFSFIGRWAEVYNMHVAYVTAQTAERRKQKVDDVRKRSEYRKAHGLEQDEGIFGGWTAKSDEEVRGPGIRDERVEVDQRRSEVKMEVVKGSHSAEGVVGQAGAAEETHVDFEGKTQPLEKKWFGIW